MSSTEWAIGFSIGYGASPVQMNPAGFGPIADVQFRTAVGGGNAATGGVGYTTFGGNAIEAFDQNSSTQLDLYSYCFVAYRWPSAVDIVQCALRGVAASPGPRSASTFKKVSGQWVEWGRSAALTEGSTAFQTWLSPGPGGLAARAADGLFRATLPFFPIVPFAADLLGTRSAGSTPQGDGYVAGVTKRAGTPASRYVFVLDTVSRQVVAETQSAANGAFEIRNLIAGREYLIAARDTPERTYNAQAADYVTALPTPALA